MACSLYLDSMGFFAANPIIGRYLPESTKRLGSFFLALTSKMSGSGQHVCQHCNRKCKTAKSLAQHQENNKTCAGLHKAYMDEKYGNLAPYQGLCFATNKRARIDENDPHKSNFFGADDPNSIHGSPFRPPADMRPLKQALKKARREAKKAALEEETQSAEEEVSEDEDDREDSDDDDDIGVGWDENTDSGEENVEAEEVNLPVDPVLNAGGPDTSLRDQFYAYVKEVRRDLMPLTVYEKKAIQLMLTLRRTRAPLESYDKIMTWHLKILAKETDTVMRNRDEKRVSSGLDTPKKTHSRPSKTLQYARKIFFPGQKIYTSQLTSAG